MIHMLIYQYEEKNKQKKMDYISNKEKKKAYTTNIDVTQIEDYYIKSKSETI